MGTREAIEVTTAKIELVDAGPGPPGKAWLLAKAW